MALKNNWAAGESFTHSDANLHASAINNMHTIAEYTSDTGGYSGSVPTGAKGVWIDAIGAGGGGGCWVAGTGNGQAGANGVGYGSGGGGGGGANGSGPSGAGGNGGPSYLRLIWIF